MTLPQVTFANLGTTLTDGFQRQYKLNVADGSLDPSQTCIWPIIGDSGSGKTTLLRLLGLIDHPGRGTLTWHLPGEEPFHLMADNGNAVLRRRRLDLYRRHFGFAFQHAPLQPQLTVIDNLRIWRQLSGKDPLTEQQIIDLASPLFSPEEALADRSNDNSVNPSTSPEERVRTLLRCYPFEALSMGEKQRFVLLQAVAHDPSVLFVDEPTANLDSHSAAQVTQFITNWAQAQGSRRLVLWVTHMRKGDSISPPYVQVLKGVARIVAVAPQQVPQGQELQQAY